MAEIVWIPTPETLERLPGMKDKVIPVFSGSPLDANLAPSIGDVIRFAAVGDQYFVVVDRLFEYLDDGVLRIKLFISGGHNQKPIPDLRLIESMENTDNQDE